jgi:enoyl-CoA hydratase/carnithine racemase
MAACELVLRSIDGRGVATITLNRPELHNALDDQLIGLLTEEIVRIGRSADIRALILTGAGDAFCAGTDVSWLETLAKGSPGDDARRLGNLLFQLRQCPKPTIARVNGHAVGTGVGLAAACDIVVAAEEAEFSLPATRLGIVPAVIGPFIIEAMGLHHARRYLLTGETFEAADARRIGLVHAAALRAQLDETVDRFVEDLLRGAPMATKETKLLMNAFAAPEITPQILTEAAKASARIRRQPEALEGLAAFIEKRDPDWYPER